MSFINDIEIPNIETCEFNTSQECKMYVNNLNRKRNSFIIAHYNVTSLNKNYEELSVHVRNHDFDVIVCSETRLLVNPNVFDIQGYVTLYSESKVNQNDGTVAYIKDTIKHDTKLVKIGQCQAIEINIKKICNTNLKILAMYRPPSTDVNLFLDGLSEYMTVNDNSNDNFIFIGDINIDISSDSSIAEKYKNILESEGCLSVINKPTRIQGNSKTTIDHIFIKSNKTAQSLKGFVLNSKFTDHYPIFAVIPYNDTHGNVNHSIMKAKYRLNNPQLINSITNENWNSVLIHNNPNSCLNNFINTINKHIKAATVKLNNNNNNNARKPWITSAILNSIQKKEELYKQHQLDINNKDIEKSYKIYKNKLTSILKNAKHKYHATNINRARNNPRKLWLEINNSTNINTKQSNRIDQISDSDNNILTEKDDIANCFNKYFSTIGETLANKISSRDRTADNKINPYTFFLTPTSTKEIYNQLICLDPRKSTGPDDIPISVLKETALWLAHPISRIINLCFENCICPDHFKLANVIPIFKMGDKSECCNYRPISITSCMAKIFERCLVNRMENFVTKHNILSSKQYGFRSGKSSDDAIAYLVSSIQELLENKKKVITVGLDLAKAFDTICHDTLLNKLDRYGFRGNILKLLSSYLSGRSQRVKLDNCFSDEAFVKFGVPQGTVLGPFLFIIYMNDIFDKELAGNIMAYADDTTIVFSDDSWSEVEKKVQEELPKVFSWFSRNSLTVNYEKTAFIPIGAYVDSLPNYNNISLQIKENGNSNICVEIHRADSLKLLGIYFDSNLKWKKHITMLLTKLRRIAFLLRKLKPILTTKNMIMVYYALFHSILSYGIIAWGGAYKNTMAPLQILQNKALKTVLSKNRLYCTKKLYEESGVPNVNNLFIANSIIRCIKYTPPLTRDYSVSTRSYGKNMQVPKTTTTASQRCFTYIGSRAYNLLPPSLKNRKINKKHRTHINRWIISEDIAVRLNL